MSAATVCPCCGGTGTSRTAASLRLSVALEALPLGADSAYENHAKGRWPWLSRVGPDGSRGRDLWVDVDMAASWFIDQGRPGVAHRLLSLAKEGGGR